VESKTKVFSNENVCQVFLNNEPLCIFVNETQARRWVAIPEIWDALTYMKPNAKIEYYTEPIWKCEL
jgi:hypothetical protein